MKVFNGVVVSDRMNKTIVVVVDRFIKHKKYKKMVKKIKKFHVHDEKNEAKVGDKVSFVETKPISKTKHFRLLEVNKKGLKI